MVSWAPSVLFLFFDSGICYSAVFSSACKLMSLFFLAVLLRINFVLNDVIFAVKVFTSVGKCVGRSCLYAATPVALVEPLQNDSPCITVFKEYLLSDFFFACLIINHVYAYMYLKGTCTLQ